MVTTRRLAAMVAVLLPGSLASQAPAERALSGVVVGERGGRIPGVEILVQRTSMRAESRADGSFRLVGVPAGLQVLVFRKIGFRPQAISVAVDSGGRALGPVVLEAGAFKLPEISVTARYAKPERYANTTKYDDFYRRRKTGGGVFLDREDIDRRFVGQTHEIFTGLPGVHLQSRPAGTGSKLWFSRCNESPPAIAVFLDGRHLLPPWGISNGYGIQRTAANDRGNEVAPTESEDPRSRFVDELIDSINPSELEAIEVFRGPGQLPGEFNLGDNCGAIVMWTKQGGFRAEATPGSSR
ncbi:MAG: carboxypeptidase regulatory-like domain-containing protein [Gemmatimonadales bacterium]